jgi:hypothetical protein
VSFMPLLKEEKAVLLYQFKILSSSSRGSGYVGGPRNASVGPQLLSPPRVDTLLAVGTFHPTSPP